MRTWRGAERALRRETAVNIGTLGGRQPLPLVIAVGAERPKAVIALGSLDTDDPTNTLAELALVAAAFRPTRALVALPVSDSPRRRSGMLVCCDVTDVADGVVEVTRARLWWRVGRRLIWPPVEVRRWQSSAHLLPQVASVILSRRHRPDDPALLEELLSLTVAAGHRLRLAR